MQTFRYLLLSVTVLFFSCGEKTKSGANAKRIDDPLASEEKTITPVFTFISSAPALIESPSAMIARMFNTVSQEGAMRSGSDSALMLANEDGSVDTYNDTEFFPVFQKDTLRELCKVSYNKATTNRELEVINFSQNFAFVLSHPPSGYKSYTDFLKKTNTVGDTLFLSVQTRASKSTENDFSNSFWSAKVYQLPRAQYKVLAVSSKYGDKYFTVR